MRNLRKGFTLLELIVVIVVMGILAAIAIPTFAGVISRANTASANTTAQAFVSEAKAIYSQDNAGAIGVNTASLEAASADVAAAVPDAALGAETKFVVTVGGKTASVDATTGAITLA